MPPAADEPRWTRATDVLWRDLPDGVLLLPADADEPLAVLGPAAECWDALTRPRTLGELVDGLAPAEADRGRVRADLTGLLDQLSAAGAVLRSDRP